MEAYEQSQLRTTEADERDRSGDGSHPAVVGGPCLHCTRRPGPRLSTARAVTWG